MWLNRERVKKERERVRVGALCCAALRVERVVFKYGACFG